MYKSLVVLCVAFCVVIEARPKWQILPPMPGYVPVYIRTGDTPLEEINPELAEAFHALPAGRSAGKDLEASPDIPEQADQPQPEIPEISQLSKIPKNSEVDDIIDKRPYEKKILEKKKKATFDISKPIERR
ncbi:uncharacterized protein LOC131843421 [Achroia grisella]|uniref:uncharacterized protein LOC131843421 n=1 Tax=Achroia grisella TaxID=688607 RepID=UPI0027D24201|nr:uncharacterized protein LOC131843421 [Achroia grisella]